MVERKGGDPPDEWVDTYWREKQESGWVPDGIRRRKDVAATTSARRRREKAPSVGTACSPQDEPRDWLAMSQAKGRRESPVGEGDVRLRGVVMESTEL